MISSVKINLDMMKNSSHWDEYPAMQSCGPLPQVHNIVMNVYSFFIPPFYYATIHVLIT